MVKKIHAKQQGKVNKPKDTTEEIGKAFEEIEDSVIIRLLKASQEYEDWHRSLSVVESYSQRSYVDSNAEGL